MDLIPNLPLSKIETLLTTILKRLNAIEGREILIVKHLNGGRDV